MGKIGAGVLFLIFCTSLYGVAFIPYEKLSNKLHTTNEKLQNIPGIEKVKQEYAHEIQALSAYEKKMLEDGDVSAKEAKAYLKKLRKIDKSREKVLMHVRENLRDAVTGDDYAQFSHIINAKLPDFFNDKDSLVLAVGYYKSSKHSKNKEMEYILSLLKKYEDARKNALALDQAQKKQEQQQAVQQQTPTSVATATPKRVNSPAPATGSFPNAESLQASYLDPAKRAQREQVFTPWLSRGEFQRRFDEGYFAKRKIFPIYTEVDENGNRRYIGVPTDGIRYTVKSARFFKDFKKLYISYNLFGKKLISLHITRINGYRIYSGVWVAKSGYTQQLQKLESYGIYPPQ